jgi:hypothetical protein
VNEAGWDHVQSQDELATAVPADALVRAGRVLVTAPTEAVLRGVPTALLSSVASDGDGLVTVTTGASPRTLLERVEREVDEVSREHVAVVDGRPSGDAVRSNPRPLRWRVRSPMDLTGTSMAVHECLSTLFEHGVSPRHFLFDSLARLVLGGEVEAVARFTHQLGVMTDAPDALGVYPVPTRRTNDDALASLEHLFGARVDVRERDRTLEIRTRGMPDATQEWTAIGPSTPDRIGDVHVR